MKFFSAYILTALLVHTSHVVAFGSELNHSSSDREHLCRVSAEPKNMTGTRLLQQQRHRQTTSDQLSGGNAQRTRHFVIQDRDVDRKVVEDIFERAYDEEREQYKVISLARTNAESTKLAHDFAHAIQYWNRLASNEGFSASRWSPFKYRVAAKIEAMNGLFSQGSIHVEEASPGNYNNCHKSGPVFWLQLWGHTRSLGMHVNNFKSFLDRSCKCWFATLYTRVEVDHAFDPATAGWVPDVSAQLADLARKGITAAAILADVSAELGSNFAWVTVSRSDQKEHWDLLSGAVSFGQVVADEHLIPTTPDDIVALSRPDIVFSHAINVPRLATVAKEVSYVLMPHHEASKIQGNDPSEMLVISKRSFWEGTCSSHVLSGEAHLPLKYGGNERSNLRLGETGCIQHSSGCGYFGPLYIYAATALKFHPFFYNSDIKMHIHRINGDFSLGVMRPVRDDRLSSPNNDVIGVVDLTQGATCAVGRVDACTVAQAAARGIGSGPKSAWGATSWTKVVGGEHEGYESGYWICDRVSDIA